MTFEELLKACGHGYLPLVIVRETRLIGQIIIIKKGDGHFGCAVSFPNTDGNTWFHAASKRDRRARYMSELDIYK